MFPEPSVASRENGIGLLLHANALVDPLGGSGKIRTHISQAWRKEKKRKEKKRKEKKRKEKKRKEKKRKEKKRKEKKRKEKKRKEKKRKEKKKEIRKEKTRREKEWGHHNVPEIRDQLEKVP